MKKRLLVLLFTLCLAPFVRAQEIAVKTNLLYGGMAQAPNLGMEVRLGNRFSLDVSGGYNWFNLSGSSENNKKLVHWLVQPELRYWLCSRFNGHFFGAHLLGSKYNISAHKLPLLFGKESNQFRYEGWAAGAGISYGYSFYLDKRWSLEANIGVGYAYMKYDRYNCPKCGTKVETDAVKHYFGPTRAGISLIYIIK